MAYFMRVACVFGCVFVLASCAGNRHIYGTVEDVVGDTVYLQRNTWFNARGIHETSNYRFRRPPTNDRAGKLPQPIVPVNSRVTIKDISRNRIAFTLDGVEYSVVSIRQYSGVSMQHVYDRYFGPRPVNLEKQFTARERQAIKDAEVVADMSREAVLVARGYPPAHGTESLESDEWLYWRNSDDRRVVYFEDGEVSWVKD